MELPDITHPAWLTAFGTLFGYGLILAVMTLTIFLIPYLFFTVF